MQFSRLQKRLAVIFLLALGLAGCGGGGTSSSSVTTSATTTSNSAITSPSPVPSPAFKQSVAITWNQAMLTAFLNTAARPTVDARVLSIVSTAMYDAWAAYDAVANGTQYGGLLRRPAVEQTAANKAAAVSYAAYFALVATEGAYETKSGAFLRTLGQLGYDTNQTTLNSLDATTPAGVGHLAANAVLTARINDGANQSQDYADVTSSTYPALYAAVNSGVPGQPNAVGGAQFNPARWVPLLVPNGKALDPVSGFPIVDLNNPASYAVQKFLTPQWGAVTPFAMTSVDQFRVPAPPQPGSSAPYTDALGATSTADQAYNAQEDAVLALNANLTDTQKCIADYWADITGSVTPPGHWNIIAEQLSYRDQQTLDQDVKMFFALNGALFDCSISCWNSKRAYDFIRPVSAIQNKYFNRNIQAWAGPGLGTQSILGQNFRPFQKLTFITPAFPDTSSGHSTFSAAAAEVLTQVTGRNTFYDGVSGSPPGTPPTGGGGTQGLIGEVSFAPHTLDVDPSIPSTTITLRYPTLQDAANDAGISRRYGGIHTQDADLFARRAGKQIAGQTMSVVRAFWTGRR